MYIFAPSNGKGAIAQLVEQRTENPCVPRSIRGGTTGNQGVAEMRLLFFVPLPKRLYGGLGLRVKPRVKPGSAMGTGVLMFCVTNPKHSQIVSIL